jgi:hypothetical protein
MPGHSASKTRVNALTCRASRAFLFFTFSKEEDVDARDKRGHDVASVSITTTVGTLPCALLAHLNQKKKTPHEGGA